MLVGSLLGMWLLPAPRTVGRVTFDVHTMLYAAAFVLLGFQAIAFAVFTKVFAISEGLLPADPTLDRLFQQRNSRSRTCRWGFPNHCWASDLGIRGERVGKQTLRRAGLLSRNAPCDSVSIVSRLGCADNFCQLLHERAGTASAMSTHRKSHVRQFGRDRTVDIA